MTANPGLCRERHAELSLSEQDAVWSPWMASAATATNAHEAGRERPWPVLHFDDVSAIPFLQDISGVEFYQLRARIRATSGDLFAATCPEVPGYEAYNQTYLGLGEPTFVYAERVESASQIALACGQGEAFEAITRAASRAQGLTVHPYMGAAPAWHLTRQLAEGADVPVRCIGPRPALSAYANQKAHVTRAAEALLDDGILGGAPVAETHFASDAESLGRLLMDLAGRHQRVALKMTRCASAMGNTLFESELLSCIKALMPQCAPRVPFLRQRSGSKVRRSWRPPGRTPGVRLRPSCGSGVNRVSHGWGSMNSSWWALSACFWGPCPLA